MKSRILLPLLMCLTSVTLGAQGYNVITKSQGLPGESARCILEAENGVMWIGTSNGVCSYNGQSVKNLRLYPEDGLNKEIMDLCEAPGGDIYAATGSGLYILRSGSDSFEKILPDISSALTVHSDGTRLYFGNKSGLHIWDGRHLKTITVASAAVGLENSVRDIVADSLIWFASREDLNFYNPLTGEAKSLHIIGDFPYKTTFGSLAKAGGNFFLGTKNNGLYILEGGTGAIHKVEGTGNIISSLRSTQDGRICVSCDGSGAFLLDSSGKILSHFSQDGSGLPSNAAYCYLRDSRGIDWFGFYRRGLCHSWNNSGLFTEVRESLGREVHSFRSAGGQTMFGTNKGAVLLSSDGSRFFSPAQLGNSNIISHIAFHQGRWYLGSFDGGLRIIDAVTGRVSVSAEKLLSSTTIASIAEDSRGRLWIGCSEGLYILGNAVTEHYTEENARIPGGAIGGLCFTPEGNAWLGSYAGIGFYNCKNDSFENTFPDNFPAGFAAMDIVEGNNGQVFFIGRNKILRAKNDLSEFSVLEMPEALKRSTIYSFLDDGQGCYWIASDNGLYCCGYDMASAVRFGCSEGLRSNLIFRLGKGKDGEIGVCTADGLYMVSPAKVEEWRNNSPVKVSLYDFRKRGSKLGEKAEDAANAEGKFSISWNFGSALTSFKPMLSDFAFPAGRTFSWVLDGSRKGEAGSGSEIVLKGLSPGRHLLEVQISGAPGTASQYGILVLPSPAFMLEFILLMLALAALVVFGRYRHRTNVLLRERNEIADALVEMSLEEEKKEVEEEKVKYGKVRLNDDECESVVGRMRQMLEEEKLYTNTDLKMSDLAEKLQVSAPKLSQIFSLYLKQNYYEFINSYRLQEFKRRLQEGDGKLYNLVSLSEMCGFKKSNFFSTFRRVEGMTPTEYLSKVHLN